MEVEREESSALCLKFAVEVLEPGLDRKAAIEGCVQHLVQARSQHEGQVLPHVRCNLLQIFLVSLRNDNSLQSSSVCCQHLVFNPPNLRRRRNTFIKTMN